MCSLDQIKQQRMPNFIETQPSKLYNGIVKQFKFSSTNKFAYTISDAMNSVRDTLYQLIRNNRNNTTQKISIGMKKNLKKIWVLIIIKKFVIKIATIFKYLITIIIHNL